MSPDTKWAFVLVLLGLFPFGLAKRTDMDVYLSHKWTPDVGWEVTCSWELMTGDRLQRVNFYKGDEEVSRYRPDPEYNFVQVYRTSENDMGFRASCEESSSQCILIINPKLPLVEDIKVSCAVEGDAPTFISKKRTLVIQTVVPPSDAVIVEVSKTTDGSYPVLNCSATGLPAPNIEWTVGNERQVDSFLVSSTWNSTSKLWDAWSTYIHISDHLPVKCTAKVTKGSTQYLSKTAEYQAERQSKSGFVNRLG